MFATKSEQYCLENMYLYISSEIYVMINLPEFSRTKCKDTPSLETPFADKTSLSRSTQNDENLPDWPDRELDSTRQLTPGHPDLL